uniref:Uncharacterized protein n=1 Tax=Anguilla anguilla TaxID=7936 RepID=A0A0E9XX24_ANGAN
MFLFLELSRVCKRAICKNIALQTLEDSFLFINGNVRQGWVCKKIKLKSHTHKHCIHTAFLE